MINNKKQRMPEANAKHDKQEKSFPALDGADVHFWTEGET
jgi:hypothetical protein